MKSAPSSAATKRSGWNTPAVSASAVPTSTGASPTGRVFGRAAISQMRTTLGVAVPVLMRRAYGRRGKREKSGARFSRKAVRPSAASSLP
jgi:hypothetical protein